MGNNFETQATTIMGVGNSSYYAGDSSGSFETNPDPHSSSVVTWGVFPNRSVKQTTIIEEESFKAWRDEAFSIWSEWAKLFPRNTPANILLRLVHKDYCSRLNCSSRLQKKRRAMGNVTRPSLIFH